ncbi:MAG: hypothetical protein L3J28_08405 [Candidatus Polarisedimenticolaceae bacterium]|nr:hypothetical protein [Candidatus Polarisedimenticolaceae bacterium]
MDATPTPYSHIGWVPCISGSLRFELTTCVLGTGSIKCDLNYLEKNPTNQEYSRQVLISSVVDWKDEGPEEKDGIYRVLLHSSFPADSKCINGMIYIIPESLAEHSWSDIDTHIKGINQLAEDKEDILEAVSSLTKALANYKHKRLYKIQFCLNESGFSFLKFDTDTQHTNKTKDTAIRQAYYYIKYSWHKHRHHNDTAESLTTTHRIRDDGTIDGSLLITDLKKSLVILKRDFHPSDYKSLYHAKGMAAYAKSLISSCYKNEFINEITKAEHDGYLDNISCSLNVLAETVQREIDTRTLVSNNFRSILLFILAFVAPLTIIFREEIRLAAKAGESHSSIAIEVISSIAGNDYFILLTAICVWLLYCLHKKMHLKYGSSFLAFQLFKDAIDLIVNQKHKADTLAKTGIFVAIAFICIGFYRLITA